MKENLIFYDLVDHILTTKVLLGVSINSRFKVDLFFKMLLVKTAVFKKPPHTGK